MMHGGGPWGGPPHQGGWDDEGDFDDMRQGPPDMNDPANSLGIDLSGEVWVETKTEEGKSYFYNARTRETTWTRPEETKGVKILSQGEVERLTQQLAEGEGGNQPKGPQDEGSGGAGFGLPPPGFMGGGPPGFVPPGGAPPGGAPYGMPPPGFPPPWGMPPPGGMPPPWAGGPAPFVEPCDWSEHTSPDGKKYYYNAKSGESVWEKPKEFAEYEKRMKAAQGAGAPNPVPAVSAPAKLTEAANAAAVISAPASSNGAEKVTEKLDEDPKTGDLAKPAAVAAAATITPAAALSAADKSKPVSSSPVSGTPWCVVWTGDNRVFFYNPTTKTSVWERPPELVGRADVSEMMK
jgi:transcription elongation regulator 1